MEVQSVCNRRNTFRVCVVSGVLGLEHVANFNVCHFIVICLSLSRHTEIEIVFLPLISCTSTI